MTGFLREVFQGFEEEESSPQGASCGHRRQRTHEVNDLLHQIDPQLSTQLVTPISSAEDLQEDAVYPEPAGRLLGCDSLSDSEDSTPCSSPVSLSGIKETQPVGHSEEDHQPQPVVEQSCTLKASAALSDPDSSNITGTASQEHLQMERCRYQYWGDRLEQQGRLQEALHYYGLCFQLEEALDTSLDDSAAIHLKIGIVYWKMSAYQESLNALYFVLSMYEDALGPTWLEQSPNFLNATTLAVSETFLLLGRVHLSLGESDEARDHVKQCLSVLSTSHHMEDDLIHPIFARALHSLGMTYEACGRHSKALKYYYEALNMQRQVYGNSHVDVAASLASIGSLQEKLGSYDMAMKCLVDALAIYESQPTLEGCQVDIGSILTLIGWICFLQGHDESAMEAYQESVDNFTAVLGPNHRNVASVRVQIGMIHNKCGRCEEALATYKAALTLQRRALGDVHEDVAITLDAMATSYDGLGKYRKAISTLDEALHIRRGALGKRHLDVGKTFANLGDLHLKIQKEQLARQCYSNAFKIFQANEVPSDDMRLQAVSRSLQTLSPRRYA
eukprot:Sro174_g076730.1 Tetratricopeptide repeat (560) ;mRNA; r:65653-67332